ncbi:MAG: thermonuclease family protein [Candidatus Melainabacteria bacterium]|nr:thermonuclease family protein [Candidatus Melainabacteria bacterium]
MLKVNNNIKKLFTLFLFLAFSFQLSAFSSSIFTNDCTKDTNQNIYKVKFVYDGDTIVLENNETIRLHGIDSFELEQNIYGKKAKDFLANLVLNKNVCIESDLQKIDPYKRTLGYVFIGGTHNLFLNEALLKNGFAILANFPPNLRYIFRLKKAQVYARQNMLGVWEKNNFILETPSQWRHKHPFKKK